MTAFKRETVHNEFTTRPSGSFADIFSSPLLVSIVIAVITLAVFIPVLSADFVAWDDDRMIYMNPNLAGLSLERLGKIFTHADVTRRYTPLAAINYSITYQVFGLNPLGYHLSAWLFHGLNAALVFFALRILLIIGLTRCGKTIEPWRITSASAAGALIWSLHPLRTEPVAWAAANFYPQAMFFLLLSLLCYLWANQKNISPHSHLRRILASAGLFTAALLSHPIVIGFIAAIIVLDVYPLGKIRWQQRQSAAFRTALLEKILFAVPVLVITVITTYFRMIETGAWEKPVSLDQFGLFERFMQAMYIWAYYLWRPWYPVNLYPCYPTLVSFDPISLPFVASALLVAGLIVLTIFLRHRRPLGLALLICHLVMLVPVLGFLEHPHFPCDRYSLIVSILWSALAAAWLVNQKPKTIQYGISLVVSLIVITTLGTLTFRQTHVWTNSKALFEHTIKTLGDHTYRSDIYWRWGRVYGLEGNVDEAIRNLSKAVEIYPDQFLAQNDLGAILMKKNLIEESIVHLHQSLDTNPNYTPAYNNMTIAMQRLGNFDKTIKYLEKFIQQKPDSVEANYWLSVALRKTGKTGQAVTHLKETLRLSPNWVNPINDLARTLATDKDPNLRDPNEAIRLAKRGCVLTNYKQADLLDTLAAAYASAGKFTDAVQYGEKALKSAELSNTPEQCEGIKNRLSLYRQGQPYIEP